MHWRMIGVFRDSLISMSSGETDIGRKAKNIWGNSY